MSGKNIRLAKPGEQTDIAQALKIVAEDMHNHIERCKLISRMMFEYKKALISEGFTEAEALEIIKAHGVRLGMMG